MRLVFVPVWAIPTIALLLVLMGVLMLLIATRHHLRRTTAATTPEADRHGAALAARINRVATMTAEHRAALVRDREHFDDLSAETRAVIAAMEAEEEGHGEQHPRHGR
jgi:CHASE1-domain containing sensor protein